MRRRRNLLLCKRMLLRRRLRRQVVAPPRIRAYRAGSLLRQIRRKRLLILKYVLWSERRRRRRAHGQVRPAARRWLVRPLLRERHRLGAWHTIVPIMRAADPAKFFEFFRMNATLFDELVASCRPALQRREVEGYLCPGERIAITLRFLASGDSMASVSFLFLVGRSTVSAVIRETTLVIWEALVGEVFPPLTTETWLRTAAKFQDHWQFPNCVGAIDGKHCVVQNFPRGGSEWYNYKKTFSMVIVAVADATYKFLAVDVGGRGCRSDGGLFSRWELGRRLRSGHLDLPAPRKPPGYGKKLPFVFVADAAFGLAPNIMTPFAGENLPDECNIFNYRLSRARRCIENAFGIMSARFRILRRTILASKTTARNIIQAVVCLHNLLVSNEENRVLYVPPGVAIGADRRQQRFEEDADVMEALPIQGPPGDRARAARMRERYTDYFLSPEGRVQWQWQHLRRP